MSSRREELEDIGRRRKARLETLNHIRARGSARHDRRRLAVAAVEADDITTAAERDVQSSIRRGGMNRVAIVRELDRSRRDGRAEAHDIDIIELAAVADVVVVAALVQRSDGGVRRSAVEVRRIRRGRDIRAPLQLAARRSIRAELDVEGGLDGRSPYRRLPVLNLRAREIFDVAEPVGILEDHRIAALDGGGHAVLAVIEADGERESARRRDRIILGAGSNRACSEGDSGNALAELHIGFLRRRGIDDDRVRGRRSVEIAIARRAACDTRPVERRFAALIIRPDLVDLRAVRRCLDGCPSSLSLEETGR